MARYIDADLEVEKINNVLSGVSDKESVGYFALEEFRHMLEIASTADVVPKSEVDKWVCKCRDWHEVAELKSQHIVELEAEFSKAKAEVEYWKQECYHACMNNGCLDANIIARLCENAKGHDDPIGADGECRLKYTKAEVKRLKAVMKDMDEQRAYTINMLSESLEKARAEVAREIFEELRKKRQEIWSKGNRTMFEAWCEAEEEVKKKYTEVNNEIS